MGGTPYSTTFAKVKPYARIIVQPGDAVPPGSPAVGSLIVGGSQPVAGISLEHPTIAAAPNSLQASRAFVPNDYGDTVHCPLLRYKWGAYETTSGLQVQNVGTATTTITVTYNIVVGSAPGGTVYTDTVAPGTSANFLQENHFSANTLASAVITNSGGQDLAAVVNDRSDNATPQRFLTYACFKDTNRTKIGLPLVKELFHQNTSGIQVQNIGTSSTHIRLTYITHTNLTFVIATTSPLAAGASKTFYLPSAGGTSGITISYSPPATSTLHLQGTVSGVIIESLPLNIFTPAQPIVAVAIESSIPASIDPQDSKGYEGVNLP
jgi:hypothetical protein